MARKMDYERLKMRDKIRERGADRCWGEMPPKRHDAQVQRKWTADEKLALRLVREWRGDDAFMLSMVARMEEGNWTPIPSQIARIFERCGEQRTARRQSVLGDRTPSTLQHDADTS